MGDDYRVGDSPFRIKGLAYLGHLEFVDAHVPGGRDAQHVGFENPAMATYFDQRFLAGGWYDVMPLAEAGLVCARLRGESLQALLRLRGQHQMERDLGGVLGFLARFASEGLIARGVMNATQRYFDFMEVETVEHDDSHVVVRIEGVPEGLSSWASVLMESYARATFERVKREEVQVGVRRTGGRGLKHGVATAELEITIRW